MNLTQALTQADEIVQKWGDFDDLYLVRFAKILVGPVRELVERAKDPLTDEGLASLRPGWPWLVDWILNLRAALRALDETEEAR